MANNIFYWDILSQSRISSTGAKLYDLPTIGYQEYGTWELRIKQNVAGTVTAVDLSSCTSFAAAVDTDFEHDVVDGALTAGFSGAVTAITADGFASAPPTAGVLTLTNAGGQSESVSYSSWTLNTGVYTFVVSATLSYTYSNDDDCDFEDTAPCIRTLNASITSTDKATGIIVIPLDGDTSTFKNAIASLENANGYFELSGFNVSGKEIFYCRFPVKLLNKVDPTMSVPPGVSSNYYTIAQQDAVYNKLVTSPTNGHVVTTNGSGQVLDSGTALTSLMTNPMTTAADIIVGGTAGAPARLAKGTGSQVLRMNSGATAQEYATLTTADIADSTDKRYVTDAQKVVIQNTSGTNTGDQTLPVKCTGAEIATGTDDARFATPKALADANVTRQGNTFNGASQLVQLDGSAKLPAIDGSQLTNLPSGFANPMTTAGDLIKGGASGTPERLAMGAANTYLRVNSGGTALEYGTPAGAGDMVLATEQTVTGAKTFNDAKLILAGSTSGTTTLKANATAGTTTITFPAASDIVVCKDTTDTLTNKTLSTGTVVSAATMTLGSDADGDIYYRSSNVLTRLAKGISGQLLKIGASSPAWVSMPVEIGVACSDETTALTAGTAKVTFRTPYAMTVTAVRASLTTAQASGNIFTVDINDGGTSILSTKLTIDNTELTSTTATDAAVISDSALADDAEITIDIDQIGNGSAKGLKVWIIGTRAV